MALPTSAVRHYRQQQAITVETAQRVDQLFGTMTDDFDASWNRIGRDVFKTVAQGQVAAATSGVLYVGAVLAETDVNAPPVGLVRPERFVGGTRDGRPLETLLQGSVYKAKAAVGTGLSVAAALGTARDWLQGAVMDNVRDANRQAVAADMTSRPKLQGWVRMLNPPSCKFCIVLGGKWFRWNTGFQSHPGCDCRHIPSQESSAGDLTIDAPAYFRSLNTANQDRIFGKRDAQAIRDGADLNQVVNIRSRGLSYTSRQAGVQTVDDIYATAKTRDEAIRLLMENGFVAPSS